MPNMYMYILLFILFLSGNLCHTDHIWTAEKLAEYSSGNRINDPEKYLTSSEQISQLVEKIEKEKNFTTYVFVISQIHEKYKENNKKINIALFLNDLSLLIQYGNKEKDMRSIFILFSIKDRIMRIRSGADVRKHLSDNEAKLYLEEIKPYLKDYHHTQAMEILLEKLHMHGMPSSRQEFTWTDIVILVVLTVISLYVLYSFISSKIKDSRPESQLEKIRKITQRNIKLKTFLEEKCIICLEDLKHENQEVSNDFTAKLDCGHLFHSQCISAWMAKNNSCPICRNSIDSDTSESKPLSEHLLTVQRVMYPVISNWEFTHTLTDFTWRVAESSTTATSTNSGGSSYSSDWGSDSGGATSSW